MNLSPFRPTRPSPRAGFTLLEMVGAIGLLTIALATITPPAIRELTRTFREAEQNKVDALSSALRSRMLRTASVPGPTNLAAELAAELGWPVDQVLAGRFGNRVVLFDDAFRVGPAPGARPAYTQGPLGSVSPANARVLILSSVGTPIPNDLNTGFLETASFASLWNTAPGRVPAGWNWAGDPDDLRIQRVSLGDLFVQVIINSPTTVTGRYSFNGAFTNPVPSASFSTFVVKGTRVGFHGPDGALQAVEVIEEPFSRTFSYAAWRADAPGAAPGWMVHQQISGCDLQAVVDHFVPSPANPGANHTPAEFVDAIAGLMQSYIDYADSGFNGSFKQPYKNAQQAVKLIANDLSK
jgi:type II secretory pathway pseudopilin PulG